MHIKSHKISMRIPERLYKMIVDITPLFDSESEALVYILKNYELSQDYMNAMEKIQRIRFQTMFRQSNIDNIEYTIKELKEGKITVEELLGKK